MRSSAPFCPIHFAMTVRDGLRTYAVHDERFRVDGPGVVVDTIVTTDPSQQRHGWVPTDSFRITTNN